MGPSWVGGTLPGKYIFMLGEGGCWVKGVKIRVGVESGRYVFLYKTKIRVGLGR